MSIKVARVIALAAVICGGMLTACDDSPDSEPAAQADDKRVVPKVAGLEPDMVAAVSAGKTASALGVHFALRAVPAVNQPLSIAVAIVPHRDFSSLRAHFESRDGLTLTAGEIFGPRGDSPKEKAITHELVLLPSNEGLFMVTAIIETESDEGTVTRVFSIPVIVGPTATAPEPAPASTPAPTGATPAAG